MAIAKGNILGEHVPIHLPGVIPIPMKICVTRMWANAQRDVRPAEYRWRPLFNATKFG